MVWLHELDHARSRLVSLCARLDQVAECANGGDLDAIVVILAGLVGTSKEMADPLTNAEDKASRISTRSTIVCRIFSPPSARFEMTHKA